jgi:hypothetical protein
VQDVGADAPGFTDEAPDAADGRETTDQPQDVRQYPGRA